MVSSPGRPSVAPSSFTEKYAGRFRVLCLLVYSIVRAHDALNCHIGSVNAVAGRLLFRSARERSQTSFMSPSGRLSAVVFSRDCGATTGFSTKVSIIPAGRSLADEAGNTFVSSGKIDLSLQWQTDFTLRVQGEGQSVFKKETQVTGVTVTYGNAL